MSLAAFFGGGLLVGEGAVRGQAGVGSARRRCLAGRKPRCRSRPGVSRCGGTGWRGGTQAAASRAAQGASAARVAALSI